ncbi:Hypothetical predicted protein, partial [Marmota monax]
RPLRGVVGSGHRGGRPSRLCGHSSLGPPLAFQGCDFHVKAWEGQPLGKKRPELSARHQIEEATTVQPAELSAQPAGSLQQMLTAVSMGSQLRVSEGLWQRRPPAAGCHSACLHSHSIRACS